MAGGGLQLCGLDVTDGVVWGEQLSSASSPRRNIQTPHTGEPILRAPNETPAAAPTAEQISPQRRRNTNRRRVAGGLTQHREDPGKRRTEQQIVRTTRAGGEQEEEE